MVLPFLDRSRELRRLARTLRGRPALVVLYGRRRLGKSRLIREVIRDRPHIYFVADARDAALQRRSFAQAVASLISDFDAVEYPDFDALTARLWREAPKGTVVAIDELPELVSRCPELPSVLQKRIDTGGGPHLVVAGSSQRMMHGLVLDASAPLYGRATEILRLEPLPAGWLGDAFGLRSAAAIVEHHTGWGGVPRYWELAAGAGTLMDALTEHVLDPLGVLHREPTRLLLDEVTDVARPASILSLVGQGCHRPSEIAARLAVPATDLSRPLSMLLDLGLLERELPYGESTKSSKRSFYRVADPFLRTWYRFVEPNRSRLGAGLVEVVRDEVTQAWPDHVGPHWESLVRRAVPHLSIAGRQWGVAGRWWGGRNAVEIDIVAESEDRERVLIGEAKRSCSARQVEAILSRLERVAATSPIVAERPTDIVLFVLRKKGRIVDPRVIDAATVMKALR